jgi:hypothetical protein
LGEVAALARTNLATVLLAILLCSCATPAPGPTPTTTPVQLALEPTRTAPSISTPAPSATPTISPANETCVRATTEIPEGQNPTRFITSGPAAGCYDTVSDFLDDIGLEWAQFQPGVPITFWTQWPVDDLGDVVYTTGTPAPIPTPSTPQSSPIGPVEIAASPSEGFHWPYFLYAPSSIQSTHILVIPNNTGARDDDFSVHEQWARDYIGWRTEWANSLAVPLLVPVFPRFDDETDGTIASQYLGRGTLEPQWQQRYPQLAREDLQLIAMVDDARQRLAAYGFSEHDKILMWGYSASAMFVSRFVALHPEMVQAAAFGGHGWATAPVPEWRGLFLPFPYGIGDLEQLLGRPFDPNAYAAVPMYVYMGADDASAWALPWYIGPAYDRTGFYESFINDLGPTSSSLLASAEQICDAIGCSASFVLYQHTGHQMTDQMDDDVLEFLSLHTH